MLQLSRTSEPIPGYVVIDRLGVGGYGEVWSAQAPGGLSKAIKFVYGYFDDERASRELKALNRIKEVRHPFLLSLERFEIVDGQLVIVTELAEMSLKDKFEHCKAAGMSGIPRAELLGYLRDAADALDYMSENFALQHLDVKPENLLLVGGRIKVADFGLCKEIQDVAASMMSGLTPLYAPPEVFDGQPSRHSDQYSLAIVYQEMLTGTLPFPGRTAAQLATQHLHSSPRLGSLPLGDQSVVTRALAKDPRQRFANCRSLIEALLNVDTKTHSAGTPPARRSPALADSRSETTPHMLRSAETHSDWPGSNSNARAGGARSASNIKTQILGDAADAPAEPEPDEVRSPIDGPVRPAVDLPPIESPAENSGLRPVLFLGIGGTAGRTLRHLRRRLRDRLGPAPIPAIQMLFLDTDAKNVHELTQGDCETALADHEVLALPLRHSHDYATDTRDILQWLSRRWLYNIPRSLQTEGRRPLGRLALVDHSQQILKRLQKAIADITSDDAISASEQTTGRQFRTRAPRIFVIASISGGTGGGMVLDAAYAARKTLADLGLSDEGVCGILIYSADRNAAARDLTIANAYACLTELNHYSGPNCYPGEPACGLPPFESRGGTFAHTYFVPLGDDLSDRDFDAATDRLASYLCFDAGTPVGAVFDRCRNSLEGQDGQVRDLPTLRTFGLAGFGGSQASLCDDATELLCRMVVNRWRGVVEKMATEATATTLIDRATQRENNSELTLSRAVESLATEHCSQLQLNFEQLYGQLESWLQEELGGDADAVLAQLRGKIEKPESNARGQVDVATKLLRAIGNLFGPPTAPSDEARLPSTPLRAASRQRSEQLAMDKGEMIAEWVLSLVETHPTRVDGACRAREWYARHLRNLEAQCADRLRGLLQNVQGLEQALAQLQTQAPTRKGLFGRRERLPIDVDASLVAIVRMRFDEITLTAAHRALRLISAALSRAGDQLKDVQEELGRLSDRFAKVCPWTNAAADRAGSKIAKETAIQVGEHLRGRMPELAQIVDDRLHAKFLEAEGGLHNVCKNSNAMQSTVPTVLRRESRIEIINALRQISVASGILGARLDAGTSIERVRVCMDSAQPKLNECGGSRRLLVILPEVDKESELRETIASLDAPATVLCDADTDLVFCYESQDLSISDVCARLAGDRADFAQTAARLHTRIDVAWSDLAPMPAK